MMLKMRITPNNADCQKVMKEEFVKKKIPLFSPVTIVQVVNPVYCWIMTVKFVDTSQFETMRKGVLVEFKRYGLKEEDVEISEVKE